jgi:hypothetical protein
MIFQEEYEKIPKEAIDWAVNILVDIIPKIHLTKIIKK